MTLPFIGNQNGFLPGSSTSSEGASLSNATPQSLGTPAAGVATAASRDDHVHPARYFIYSGRTSNLPASTTLVLTSMTAYSACAPRAGKICGWTFQTNASGLNTTPTAGSALTIQVVRTSAAGTADAAVTIASIPVGTVNLGSMTLLNPITLSAGDCAHVVVVSDSSWTSTTADPCVALIFEET